MERTLAEIRVGITAALDWHESRRERREAQAVRYARLSETYASCMRLFPASSAGGPVNARAETLSLAAGRRAMAYAAAARMDVQEAWQHYAQMRGHLRRGRLTAKVWKS
jgi:hypothetical protein